MLLAWGSSQRKPGARRRDTASCARRRGPRTGSPRTACGRPAPGPAAERREGAQRRPAAASERHGLRPGRRPRRAPASARTPAARFSGSRRKSQPARNERHLPVRQPQNSARCRSRDTWVPAGPATTPGALLAAALLGGGPRREQEAESLCKPFQRADDGGVLNYTHMANRWEPWAAGAVGPPGRTSLLCPARALEDRGQRSPSLASRHPDTHSLAP